MTVLIKDNLEGMRYSFSCYRESHDGPSTAFSIQSKKLSSNREYTQVVTYTLSTQYGGLFFFYFKNPYFCLFVICICLSAHPPLLCGCLQLAKEDTGCLGSGVMGSCESLDAIKARAKPGSLTRGHNFWAASPASEVYFAISKTEKCIRSLPKQWYNLK